MKKITIFMLVLICALLLVSFSFTSFAQGEAANIAKDAFTLSNGVGDTAFLFDGKDGTYKTLSENTSLTFEDSGGIGSLYIMFALSPGEYIITDNDSGETAAVGTYGFLHEYIDITALFGKTLTSVTISFQGSVKLSEIYVFTAGETPSFVQKWLPPLENNTDLLLFATHGDDDQLFFAGLLPHYAKYEGYRVQVAYLTDHRNLTEGRVHEMLNGLWAVGVTAYPVFGTYADFRIDDMEQTYKQSLALPARSFWDLLQNSSAVLSLLLLWDTILTASTVTVCIWSMQTCWRKLLPLAATKANIPNLPINMVCGK